MTAYNLNLQTLSQLLKDAAQLSTDYDQQARYILDRLANSNGSHSNLADITSQKIADMKHADHSGSEPFPGCNDCGKDYDSDGEEGERYAGESFVEDAGSSFYGEDNGRYINGHRVYRSGSSREDFGSDR